MELGYFTMPSHPPERDFKQGHDWDLEVIRWLDELGYERGNVDTSLPFEELRRVSDIGERARASGNSPDFSKDIRVGLPGDHPSVEN